MNRSLVARFTASSLGSLLGLVIASVADDWRLDRKFAKEPATLSAEIDAALYPEGDDTPCTRCGKRMGHDRNEEGADPMHLECQYGPDFVARLEERMCDERSPYGHSCSLDIDGHEEHHCTDLDSETGEECGVRWSDEDREVRVTA